MTDFVPPYPPRFSETPSVWKRLSAARHSLIAIWEDKDFEYEFTSGQLFARRTFLCNCPDAVRFVFSSRNDSFARKSPQQRHALAPLIGDGLLISDGDTWRVRRKLLAPITHASRIPDFAKVMVAAATDMRDRWLRLAPGAEIDVHAEMGALTADIICRTVFGNRLAQADAREVTERFGEYQNLVEQVDLASLVGLPDWIPRPRSRGLRRAVRGLHAVLSRLIAEHAGRDEESVLGHLARARDAGDAPLQGDALRNEIAVMFLAGLESSANALSWTWYLLSQVPDAEARFHAEIDHALGGRAPTFADVPKLVYTRAVLDEALRLYPPLPFLSREALREETFRDRTIPKGSLMFVVPWLLHRHRKWWERPDHFDPSRFLPDAPQPSKFAYIPFSIGPRVCTGMAFGTVEAVMCLATIAQVFRLVLRRDHAVKPVARLTLRPEGGLPMTLARRAVTVSGDAPPSVPELPHMCPHAR